MKKLKAILFIAAFSTLSLTAMSQGDSAAPQTALEISQVTSAPMDTVAPAVTLPSVTSDITGISIPTLGWIGIGLLGYFITRFRIMAADTTIKFDFGIWISRNWLNCIYVAAALFAIQHFHVALSSLEAIALGSAPNLLIDWVQRELKAIGFSTTRS